MKTQTMAELLVDYYRGLNNEFGGNSYDLDRLCGVLDENGIKYKVLEDFHVELIKDE